MPPQRPRRLGEWVQTAANIGSLAVAIVALAIAFNAEKRNAERFHAQLEQSSQIARANIRPLLSIASSGFVGVKLVVLKNDGLGTAMVKRIRFTRDNDSVLNLADLFRFDRPVVWDNFYVFADGDFFLPAGEQVTLVNLTSQGLRQQGFEQAEIADLMSDFDRQMRGIHIVIDYEDLLGNPQQTLTAVW